MNARVPCPCCGGPVHPIAGRCKHCKQDLSTPLGAQRSSRGTLPSLASLITSPAAQAVAMPTAKGAKPGGGLARNWPLLVIVVAMAAMIVALVLLVLPRKDGARRAIKPPSNDRMETDPLPPRDPWAAPAAPAPPAPAMPPGGARGAAPTAPDDPDDPLGPFGSDAPVDPSDPATIDPPNDDDDGAILGPRGGLGPDDLIDPLAPLDPDGSTRLPVRPPSASQFLSVMVTHLCQRISSCGGDQVYLAGCLATRRALQPSVPRCYDARKALQCLRTIDRLPCSTQSFSITRLQGIPACFELITC